MLEDHNIIYTLALFFCLFCVGYIAYDLSQNEYNTPCTEYASLNNVTAYVGSNGQKYIKLPKGEFLESKVKSTCLYSHPNYT